jgi:hypothetical protein
VREQGKNDFPSSLPAQEGKIDKLGKPIIFLALHSHTARRMAHRRRVGIAGLTKQMQHTVLSKFNQRDQ